METNRARVGISPGQTTVQKFAATMHFLNWDLADCRPRCRPLYLFAANSVLVINPRTEFRLLSFTPLKHIFWIEPSRLAGRPGPVLEPWVLAEIGASGISAVLNVSDVEPVWSEHRDVGIEVKWVPLPNHYPATLETEEACVAALPKAYAFVAQKWEAQQGVLVHCAWGRDRTGMVLAYHLVRRFGLSPGEAIARVRQSRPEALTAPGWEDMAHRVFAKLTA